ncbi:MAG TPA: flavin reductase family protein [Actinobacteria bacterium]|nr:flavin reductase family protein [Actinomycetota bacterium]
MAKVTTSSPGALFPTPVVLVTTVDDNGRANIITLAWVGIVCSNPLMISAAIRPNRHSHGLLKTTPELVVNVPTRDLVAKTDYCGCVSGRTTDKFAATGFTALSSQQIKPPMIQECPINLECRVVKTLSLGSHDVFISEVVLIHVDEELLNDKGKADFTRTAPFSYIGMDYWALTDKIGHYGFTKGVL